MDCLAALAVLYYHEGTRSHPESVADPAKFANDHGRLAADARRSSLIVLWSDEPWVTLGAPATLLLPPPHLSDDVASAVPCSPFGLTSVAPSRLPTPLVVAVRAAARAADHAPPRRLRRHDRRQRILSRDARRLTGDLAPATARDLGPAAGWPRLLPRVK